MTSKQNLFDLPACKLGKNEKMFRTFQTYKSIVRNLEEADAQINYVNQLKMLVKDGNSDGDHTKLYLANASLMYAVIIYSRWFKSTESKLRLSCLDFFAENSNALNTHNYIINLRDKSLAHNQDDSIESDLIFAHFDEHQNCIRITSDSKKTLLLADKKIEGFQECIQTILHKINSDNLPSFERKILNIISPRRTD